MVRSNSCAGSRETGPSSLLGGGVGGFCERTSDSGAEGYGPEANGEEWNEEDHPIVSMIPPEKELLRLAFHRRADDEKTEDDETEEGGVRTPLAVLSNRALTSSTRRSASERSMSASVKPNASTHIFLSFLFSRSSFLASFWS